MLERDFYSGAFPVSPRSWASPSHAQPGGLVQFLLRLIQELPHAFPLRQILQQAAICTVPPVATPSGDVLSPLVVPENASVEETLLLIKQRLELLYRLVGGGR